MRNGLGCCGVNRWPGPPLAQFRREIVLVETWNNVVEHLYQLVGIPNLEVVGTLFVGFAIGICIV